MCLRRINSELKFSRPARLLPFVALAGLVIALAGQAAGPASAAARPPTPRPASVGPGLRVPPSKITDAASYTCAAVAYKAGFSYTYYLSTSAGEVRSIVVAVAICLAESGGNPSVYLCNPSLHSGDYPPISCPSGTTSVDRGLWQINSHYHPEVSDACAFQVQCNADAAWNISSHGTSFSQWATYNSGAWRNYLPTAQGAISGFTITLDNQGAAGKCVAVDASNITDGGKIWQWGCANEWMDWKVITVSATAPPELQNPASGKCLAVDASDVTDGGTIWQWGCGANEWLEWN